MYVPSSFAEHDPVAIRSFVRRHSFAMFTSVSANGDLAASHLPLLLDEKAGSQGTLVGHMARANPQWRSLEGRPVVAVFTGPHAYISPTWYAEPHTVPTWNYTAVHVYGTCRLVQDMDELGRILQDTVTYYEGSMPEPWQFDSTSDFARRLAAQVVGFRVDVSHWEAKWKLGQNHAASRRRRTIAALDAQPDAGSREIAELMRATLETDADGHDG
jgi:transcriptional regulator